MYSFSRALISLLISFSPYLLCVIFYKRLSPAYEMIYILHTNYFVSNSFLLNFLEERAVYFLETEHVFLSLYFNKIRLLYRFDTSDYSYSQERF